MPFIETLLATICGAFFAWAFALDLGRRANKNADRARLDTAIADVVRLLGEYSGVAQAFEFATTLNSAAVPAAPPNLARQQLLSATLVARMAACKDEAPLLAVYEVLTTPTGESSNRLGTRYERIAHILVRWRQGELSTKDAEAQIIAGSAEPNVSATGR